MVINYFDRDGEIKPTLFSEDAARVVEEILTDQNPPKENQVRKFYDEVLNFKSRLEQGERFREILPYLKMLKAKTHVARERNLINRTFKEFLDSNVDYITNPQLSVEEMERRFKIFCTFFEGVVAFYKGSENRLKKAHSQKVGGPRGYRKFGNRY